MKTVKVTILSFALLILFSFYANAQDNKSSCGTKTKETVKEEKSGCSSETISSCCDTEEKTASTIKPWNEVCPVLGNKVSATTKTVEYKGKVYGFCCPGCDDKFSQDPEKYLKNLSSDGKKFNKAKS